MASRYESMSGQAWHDELQSFLPHALDCVDPNCLLPLCVNLKLTLRHAQDCKQADNCTICQGMKSLASSHSHSCRDYYCRVPFCMEAKVTAQQQVLMDELGKVFDEVLDSQEDGTIHQLQDTKEECRRNEVSRIHSDSRCMAVGSRGTSAPVELNDGSSGSTSAAQGPMSISSYLQPATKNSTQVPDSVAPILPELKERSSTVQQPKRAQSGLHESLHGKYISTCTLEQLPSATEIYPVKSQPRPAPKRKCQAINISTSESAPPPAKVTRGTSVGFKSQKDDGPEIEIIGIKSPGLQANQFKGKASPNDTADRRKVKSSKAVFSQRVPLRNAAKKQNESADSMTHQCHFTERSTLPKKAPSFKPSTGLRYSKVSAKSLFTFSDSSHTDFHQACQDEGQVSNDLVQDFLEEMFSTPPPSPTFEMWLGENVGSKENSSALKVVLLETLFQLFGVVTQPKTEKQEAVFVDLLERTLGMMKTEIAK